MSVPDDLLDLYFDELGTVPLLTAEEEVELAKQIEDGREAEDRLRASGHVDEVARAQLENRIKAGHKAFDRFVSANLRLVVAEASKFARRSRLDLDELVQEGNLGLIRAVEKFDWRRGFKFSTYATWWIRQALQRGTAKTERAIRLPTGVHAKLLKVRAAEARLGAELGRPPCLDELSDATRLSEDEVRQSLAVDFAVTSLDKPVSQDDDAAELGALIARAGDAPADEVIDQIFVEDVLDTARRDLSERSWYVLQRRYGLNGSEPATLQALGAELGVSRETIRKIEQQALAKLQRSLASAAA
ncbi:MAG TPA: sigma-70 family RNA polymerase sigma factor [Egibacteraceae bacterium]|nr:sigma-70 family RNA polymerase sigma factor [Egibacteraceae bacterium]